MKMKPFFPAAIVLAAALTTGISSPGQAKVPDHKPFRLYLQTGAGPCTRNGGGGGAELQATLRDRWVVTASYKDLSADPHNKPSDFIPETGVVFFFPYEQHVSINLKLYSLTAGRFFKTGRNTWCTTEAGVSLAKGQTAHFQKQGSSNTGTGFWLFGIVYNTSNYRVTYANKSSLGAMLKADWNWAYSRYAGLGLGAYYNINGIQSPLGCEFKLMFGAMGREHRKRK